MADKPKITGLSFNIYAIVGLLVILPISTAIVTNLSNTNQEDYISINTEYMKDIQSDQYSCDSSNNDFMMLNWLDKGINQTMNYEYIEQTNDPYLYDSIWDETLSSYQYMSPACPQSYVPRNDKLFLNGYDDHFYLAFQGNQGNIPNYHGYIGYSGDDFSFRVDENMFKHLDDTQDISSIKMTFIDQQTGYACDNSIFENVEFKADIKLIDDLNSKSYNNFKFSQENSYFVTFDPSINPTSFCHISISVEFDFNPFESIEINELFTNYDNLSAEIRLYDFDITNQTFTGNSAGQPITALPFNGDSLFAYDFEVAYVDTATTNFYLKGGTLLIGVGLFALALASTPYWNPITNAFKPKGGM